MILIVKKKEPDSLIQYRKSSNASFDDLDGNVKDEIRTGLLQEQGYLCAYCMKRLRDDRMAVKIEHYQPRNSENELQYSNLLAVCDGNQKSRVDPDRFTCDTRKADRVLKINPQIKAHMDTVSYKMDGRICSSEAAFERDLNETLNLNDAQGYLRSNRRAAIKPIAKKLSECRNEAGAVSLLKKLKISTETINRQGQYPEYAGIQRWYIDRQLRKHNESV